MSKIQIPFTAGMHGEMDPAMLPQGALTSIENGRLPREGAIVKARGTTTGDVSVTTTSAAIAAPIEGFAEFGTREWLAANGRVYARGQSSGDAWQEVGRTPRYFPVRERWAQFDDTRTTLASAARAACATTGGYLALTWASTDGSTYNSFLRVMRPTGECVATRVAGSRYFAQLIAVGSYFIWAYKKSDDSEIFARRYDPVTNTLGSEVSLESGIVTTSDAFRVAVHSATQWFYWRRDSVGSVGWQLRGIDASLTQADSGNTPCANQVVTRIQSLSTADGVYMVYADDTATIGGDCFWVLFEPDMSAEIADGTVLSGSDVAEFGIIDRGNNSVFIVCGTYGTGSEHSVAAAVVTSAGSYSSSSTALRMVKMVSHPFAATTTEIRMWVRVDNSVDPTANVYALATLQMGSSIVMQPELLPDSRPPNGFVEPTEVLTVGDSLFFLGSVVVRTGLRQGPFSGGGAFVPGVTETAPALVFYEYEAASGFRASDAAGAGYCFGGSGLVLPSDRAGVSSYTVTNPTGVEDGFMRRPQCSMAATAGAGLTSGALYQAFVVFERIDTDIRRIRSAPSSLLTATPSGGNLQVTISILVHPRTEGEISSLTHATAAHVYMTAANGSIFYRVTPDDGAPPGVSNTTTFTYVQTTEPATTKELLYTLGNVIPNAPAPAHRHGTVAAGRGWAFGLFDPRIVECSKLMVPNEPLTWTRHPAFRTFAPIDVTCGEEIDGSIVLLGPGGVALMPSSGPNNQGSPALSAPVVVSRVGCVNPSSLLRCPQGLLYEGQRGLYLMPRGGGEPIYMGAGMMSEIAHVSSAALVTVAPSADRLPQLLAAFAYEDIFAVRKVAYLDPEYQRWVGFDGRECSVLGTFGAQLVSDNSAGTQIVSDATTQATGTNLETTITTGHIYPFGPLGHGTVSKVQLLFTVKQLGVRLYCATSIDGGPFDTARELIIPDSTSDGLPLTIGQLHAVEWSVRADRGGRELSSIRFRFSDRANVAGDGVAWHGCALEGKAMDGLRALAPTLRSA